MSKLTDFYAHRAAINEQDPRWEQMEDQLLKEELLPALAEQMKTVLSKVKSPLMFSGFYDPNGGLSLSFTRNCIMCHTDPSLIKLASQSTSGSGQVNSVQTTLQYVEEEVRNELVAENDDVPEQEEEETVETGTETEPKRKKAKSIVFSVSFRDGTVFHEPKAVNTWIKALKKIGLENIYNNRSKHQAWQKVEGKDICIVEPTETIRKSDGKSPQKIVNGFYVMVQLANDQKVKNLMALAEFMPKMGITVTWNNETEETATSKPKENPAIDKSLPIKEQFRAYLTQQVKPSTANSYISTLDNAVREWVNKEVDSNADSVFSYSTADEARICIEMLYASPAFVAENTRKHNSMSAALNQYLLFVKDLERRTKE